MEQKDFKLNFELTLEEINFILQLVGKEPYVNVVGLIKKIEEQAKPQLVVEPKPLTVFDDSDEI